jgi:hypothetical protein
MEPDVHVKVRFKTTEEGGRQSAVSGDFYACPFLIEGKGFDSRLLLGGRRLELGETYEVPVKFLNSQKVLPHLTKGKSFILWEGKDVASGSIISIQKKSERARISKAESESLLSHSS